MQISSVVMSTEAVKLIDTIHRSGVPLWVDGLMILA